MAILVFMNAVNLDMSGYPTALLMRVAVPTPLL